MVGWGTNLEVWNGLGVGDGLDWGVILEGWVGLRDIVISGVPGWRC